MKSKHGGARPNSGKKVAAEMKRGPMTVNIPKYLRDKIRAMDGTISSNVESALISHYELSENSIP